MIPRLGRARCQIVFGIALLYATADAASAQSLEPVKARIPIGDIVYVTDTTGATIKGALAAVTDDRLQVRIGSNVRSVAAADVRRVQWQPRDSPLTGALIGAGIGAIPGIYYLAADPNECTGMCPEEYASIALGAAVGGLIDQRIKKKVTVYPAAAAGGRTTNMVIRPFVVRDRLGARIALTF